MKIQIKWAVIIFGIWGFIFPKSLEELSLVFKLLRGIMAYLVLQIWIKGGSISGRLTNPIHHWLRRSANGRTKAAVDEFLRRLDLPD